MLVCACILIDKEERTDEQEGHCCCCCLWNSGHTPLGGVRGVGVVLEAYLFSPGLVSTNALVLADLAESWVVDSDVERLLSWKGL